MTAPNNGWVSQWSNLNVDARQFWVNTNGTGRLVVLYTRVESGPFGINTSSLGVIGQTAPNNGWSNFGFLKDLPPVHTVG
jgi:hypothetical protein